ncbi:DNA polymerase III subunit delta [Kineobactrum sediminis]|uniref:DNA polymerase III subunit delta n=1 Tax=Kineobactrum sediminis TaxID=1905677 RepID=A0A2N5Y5Z5_9GAMM|nr:DNA polymerase III subunit delta [Kineobactrum sediminis]PLW83818.1 DNA polymerase III subunit delta [Kineobactrum sediminis]
MQLKPEQLRQHLQQQCLPVYLLHGEETLLVQECADQIRAAARRTGCSEREIIDTSPKDFSWQALLNCAAEMSLFGDRRLIELHLPGGKPGAEGSKALCEYVARASGDDVLLVISGKIDKQSQSSKWYKTLDQAGATLQIWPVKAQELPRWLRRRLEAAGLGIDDDALELLSERLEGNLLAAVQEVEKLKLLASDQRVTIDTVTMAVLDNARYNLFDMVDTALRGDAATSLRMVHGLRAEGTELIPLLWGVTRELRSLYAMQVDCEAGQPAARVLSAHRVWSSRTALVQAALKRHSSQSLGELLQLALEVDGCLKGYARGDPWDRLDRLLFSLAA